MSAGRINREFKLRCADPERIRALLRTRRATFKGIGMHRDI